MYLLQEKFTHSQQLGLDHADKPCRLKAAGSDDVLKLIRAMTESRDGYQAARPSIGCMDGILNLEQKALGKDSHLPIKI